MKDLRIQEFGFSQWKFSGSFEHAFIYKGRLFALDGEGSFWYLNLDEVSSRSFPSNVFSLERRRLGALFIDNRELSEAELAPASQEESDSLSSWSRHVGPDVWRHVANIDSNLRGHQVLDITVYYDRIYLSTTGGVFHINLAVTEDIPEFSHPIQRSDAYSLSSTVRFSCVAVSCGDDGLFIGTDDFDKNGQMKSSLDHLGGRSFRASWFANNLLAYERNGVVKAYHGMTADLADDVTGKPVQIITKLEPASSEQGQEIGIDHVSADDTSIAISYNVDSNCVVVRSNGVLELTDRLRRSGRYFSRVFFTGKAFVGRPLDAFPVVSSDSDFGDARVGVHTRAGVYLVNRSNILRVSDHQAVSVKSFPSSKRYKNLVAVIDEDSIGLCSSLPNSWLILPRGN